MGSGGSGELVIGRIADPESTIWWSDFKAFLGPAQVRGGVDTLLGPNELLWGVFEAGAPIAAATARLLEDGSAEVILVGGSAHEKWLSELDHSIGAAAAEAGATHLVACGRRGWLRKLRALGWASVGERDGFVAYRRKL